MKYCKNCGKEIIGGKDNKIFCTNRCGVNYRNQKIYAAIRNNRETVTCAFDGCENQFTRPVGSKKQKYCTDPACKKERHKVLKREQDAKRRRDTLNTNECILDKNGKIPDYYLRRGNISNDIRRADTVLNGNYAL